MMTFSEKYQTETEIIYCLEYFSRRKKSREIVIPERNRKKYEEKRTLDQYIGIWIITNNDNVLWNFYIFIYKCMYMCVYIHMCVCMCVNIYISENEWKQ